MIGRTTGTKSSFQAAMAAAFVVVPQARAANVTIDAGTQYQTIRGWGATAWVPVWITPAVRDELIAVAVDDLGLTRLRVEPPAGNRSEGTFWEWSNDDGDPDNINWAAFNTADLDTRILSTVLPFKQRVEANGDPFDFYVSGSFFDNGGSGPVPVWLLHSPGENAEYATSLLLHLWNAHGLIANYYCILNEAGNANPFTPQVVGTMIKTLGPKLQALGLPTMIEFPECIDANTSWSYIQALQNDAAVWPFVGVITYHLYGANSDRPNIRDFAVARGLPTGQTEYMGLTMDHLYDDLTLGGVSYWEIYGFGSQFEWNYTRLVRHGQYWNFRQVLHYVRPGAVRVEAASDDGNLRSLAFVDGGRTTTVLINGPGQRNVTVNNLPAGVYGVCSSTGPGPYQEMGLRTVDGTGTLNVNVPSGTVLTVYPYSGLNQPPTPTHWAAASDYLTMPVGNTTLTASATDPELDPISYAWSVSSQPVGANVIVTNPSSATTSATGLTVAGDYVFAVVISDGAVNSVARTARITVFANNQPPVPDNVSNRYPVMITLPTSSTTLTAWGWDMENDPLGFQWSVVGQPAGAAVSLQNADTSSATATGMTVAGDYVFELQLSDPTHVVAYNHVVPVHPLNAAPTISNATASPAVLTLPAGTTTLSATTGDPDGDVLTHWWAAEIVPPGAAPVFANPGSATTAVSGLTVPGNYVFELIVIDRTLYSIANVTVTVFPGSGGGNLLVDPGFESDGVGWVKSNAAGRSIVTNPVHSGAKAQEILVADQWPGEVYQDVPVSAGSTYDAAGWIKCNGLDGNGATISLLWLDAAGLPDELPPGSLLGTDVLGTLTNTQNWTRMSGRYPAPAGAVVVRFRLFNDVNPDGLGTAWFDDHEVVPAGAAPGDCDGDGDVDLSDYVCFQACLTGPGGGVPPGCASADITADNDVDLEDFAGFQVAYTGSQ